MLRLRPYRKEDAKEIVTWMKDEVTFRKWSANLFESYPIGEKELNEHYETAEKSLPDRFFPMTAYDETGIVGHLFFRFPGEDKKIVRFGYVIVSDQKRGQGYGKEMIRSALEYVYRDFHVEKVTLGVFENNPSAYYCYKAAGFVDVEQAEEVYYPIMGEQWKCLELVQRIINN